MRKPRLFVDMDGTLAEFRKIHIDVDEMESVEAAQRRLNAILRAPGYFFGLDPQTNVIEAIKRIVKEEKIEVYIITCFLTNCSAREEKNAWLDKYLPEIDVAHRIFVPDGQDKRFYVPNGVSKSDWLLDDYTHNLNLWCISGSGIKLWNGINGNKGNWTESALRYDRKPKELANYISKMIFNKMFVRDKRPQENSILYYTRCKECLLCGNYDELIECLFDKWWNTYMQNSNIHYTKSKSQTPIFRDYDDWKTANADDYIKGQEIIYPVEKEDVVEYMVKNYDEDLSEYLNRLEPDYKDTIDEMQENANLCFKSLYPLWEKTQIRKLENTQIEEYELA